MKELGIWWLAVFGSAAPLVVWIIRFCVRKLKSTRLEVHAETTGGSKFDLHIPWKKPPKKK